MVVTASITFGSSLSFLVSHPRLYGWGWDYALLSRFLGHRGTSRRPRPPPPARSRPGGGSLGRGVFRAHEPGRAGSPRPGQQPERRRSARRCCPGTACQAASQVVLGQSTLAQLHRLIGNTVTASTGQGPPFRLRIVGTATSPAIGSSGRTVASQWALSARCSSPPTRSPLRPSTRKGPRSPHRSAMGSPDPADPPASAAAQQLTSTRSPRLSTGRRTPTAQSAARSPPSARPRSPATARWLHRRNARLPARRRGDQRARAHPDRLGPAAETRAGAAQDPGLRRPATGTHRWPGNRRCPAIAGVIVGLPPRHRHRALALDAIRPRDSSAVPDPNVPVPYIAAVAFGAVLSPTSQPLVPGIIRRPHAHRPAPAERVATTRHVRADRSPGAQRNRLGAPRGMPRRAARGRPLPCSASGPWSSPLSAPAPDDAKQLLAGFREESGGRRVAVHVGRPHAS